VCLGRDGGVSVSRGTWERTQDDIRRDVRIPKAAELVAEEIRRQIVAREVAQGEALPNEAELVEAYGVSRPTIREALRVLEAEGLIEVKRGVRGGPRVRLPDVSVSARHISLLLQMRGVSLVDLAEARRILEPAAVRELAQRVTRADIDALRAVLEAERASGDNHAESARQASRFHAMVIELAGNHTTALLNELLEGILESQGRATLERMTFRSACEVVESSRSIHEEFVALLEEGRAEQAEELWVTHLEARVELTRNMFGGTRLVDIRTMT
jgi:GntR family transcriptional regulator, transcriptional repressor for pyruvate dehydrogenase complex